MDIALSGLAQVCVWNYFGEVTAIDSDVSSSQSEDGENSSYFKIYIRPDSEYLVSKEGDKVNIYNGMAVEARIQYE